jgi:hypothetical protein
MFIAMILANITFIFGTVPALTQIYIEHRFNAFLNMILFFSAELLKASTRPLYYVDLIRCNGVWYSSDHHHLEIDHTIMLHSKIGGKV